MFKKLLAASALFLFATQAEATKPAGSPRRRSSECSSPVSPKSAAEKQAAQAEKLRRELAHIRATSPLGEADPAYAIVRSKLAAI